MKSELVISPSYNVRGILKKKTGGYFLARNKKLQNFLFLASLEFQQKIKNRFYSQYSKGDITLKGWAEKIMF